MAASIRRGSMRTQQVDPALATPNKEQGRKDKSRKPVAASIWGMGTRQAVDLALATPNEKEKEMMKKLGIPKLYATGAKPSREGSTKETDSVSSTESVYGGRTQQAVDLALATPNEKEKKMMEKLGIPKLYATGAKPSREDSTEVLDSVSSTESVYGGSEPETSPQGQLEGPQKSAMNMRPKKSAMKQPAMEKQPATVTKQPPTKGKKVKFSDLSSDD